jgi:hypothetical protein
VNRNLFHALCRTTRQDIFVTEEVSNAWVIQGLCANDVCAYYRTCYFPRCCMEENRWYFEPHFQVSANEIVYIITLTCNTYFRLSTIRYHTTYSKRNRNILL